MSAETINERIQMVRQQVEVACRRVGRSPEEVTIVAISKGSSVSAIIEALASGILDIGENRVQEARKKIMELRGEEYRQLSHLSRQHLVGHLQTNKIRNALQLFDIIHSVDSVSLAKALDSRSENPTPVFLEVNVSEEEGKFGFQPEALEAATEVIYGLPGLDVRGLMTVASSVAEAEDVRPQFARLRELASSLGLEELSMGMTNDFEVAIEEGSTMVRIGRAIFGERS